MSDKPSAEQAPAGQPEIVGDLQNCEYCGGFGNQHSKVCVVLELSRSKTECDELRSQLDAQTIRLIEEQDVHKETQAQLSTTREIAQKRFDDSMIAHRWFEKHFGEVMNGRDFAVKCSMADERMAGAREIAKELAAALEHYDTCDQPCVECDRINSIRARAAGLLDAQRPAEGSAQGGTA